MARTAGASGHRSFAVLVTVAMTFGVAAGPAGSSAPVSAQLRSEQVLSIRYNQGIARFGSGWVVSGTLLPLQGTDVLARLDDQLHVIVTSSPAIPPQWRARGFDHIGDIDVVGHVVYAPFEQSDFAKGQQATARFDARTLRFIDAVELPQHENSFVAVDRATKIAYSMDHFDGDALLRYDVARGWKPLPPLHMTTTLHHTQGASVAHGAVWIATSDDHNGLYRVRLATGRVDAIGQLGHPGGEGEGIEATRRPSGVLHALVIDPDQSKVWLEHFGLSKT